MAETLLPCPFCSGNFVAQGASQGFISVWCGDCGARGPEVKFPDHCMPGPPVDECREAWNRRAALLPRPVEAGVPQTPRSERMAELPDFMVALSEWGCTEPSEQAQEITNFLNSLVGLRGYLEAKS